MVHYLLKHGVEIVPCGVTVLECREMSSMSWQQLSVLSISGLVVGACALTCAVCCCCKRRHRRRQRRREAYQQHDLYDNDDADLCACVCCPSTSALYACKYSSMSRAPDRTLSFCGIVVVRDNGYINDSVSNLRFHRIRQVALRLVFVARQHAMHADRDILF